MKIIICIKKFVFLMRFFFCTKLMELCLKQHNPWDCVLLGDESEKVGNLILGRYLLSADIPILKRQYKNLRLLISCLEDYESSSFYPIIHTPGELEFINYNLQYFNIPIKEFTANISMKELHIVLNKIQDILLSGDDVYVHCRAGLGRSCMIVICYLVIHKKMNAIDAIDFLKSKRKYINPSKSQKEFVFNL